MPSAHHHHHAMKLVIPRSRRHDQRGPRRLRQVARRMGSGARRAGSDRAAQPQRLAHRGRHQPVGRRARAVRHGLAQRHAPEDAPDARRARRPRRCGVLLPACPEDCCACRKPLPGCSSRSASASPSTCARCRWSATRCATCRPAWRWAASRTWCAPAKAAPERHERTRCAGRRAGRAGAGTRCMPA